LFTLLQEFFSCENWKNLVAISQMNGNISITSVAQAAYSFIQGFFSACQSVPCVQTTAPEEIELINGAGTNEEGSNPFEFIRLLSYNIFVRMPT
jgi:hypothetical protein